MNSRWAVTEGPVRGWASRASLFIALVLLFVSWGGSSPLEAQEQRKLRHILVANEPVANKLMAAAQSGTDFKSMARRYSLDVGTKILGGDLDWVSPGQMEPEFSNAAFNIPEVGGFTTCKTRYGWHVIQFVDIRGVEKPVTPAEPEVEVKKPQTDAETPKKPEATGDAARQPVPVDPMAERNDDLGWEVTFSDRAYVPGDDVQFTIRVTNKTDQELQLIDPRLWPLGMIVRYQFGKMNVPVILPGELNSSEFRSETLAAGAKVQRSYSLKDYLGAEESWPIVRVIWRGDIVFTRMKELGIDTSFVSDLDRTQARWRFYRSEEANFNVLPLVKSGDRWFLCLFSNGRIWIELDPNFFPELREFIIASVRDGRWDRVGLEVVSKEGIFFGLVDQGRATGVPYSKGTDKGSSVTVFEKGDFLAMPSKLSDGRFGYGKRFGIVSNPEARQLRDGLKIGRIVLEEGDPLNRIEERKAANQQVQLTLALAWPESLLPERTLKEIERVAAEPSKPESSPEKATGAVIEKPKVTIAPQAGNKKDKKPVLQVPDPQQAKPVMTMKPLPTVFMETDNGSFLIRLYEDDAPNTVAHFIHLVEEGFYDGKIFHRRVQTGSNKGFIQGGSPDGTSAGVLDYTIKDEPSKNRLVSPYTLVMARHHTRPDSASSQFLIALDNLAYLNGTYTVFGEIISGQKSASRLNEGAKIKKVTVRSKRDGDYRFEKVNPEK